MSTITLNRGEVAAIPFTITDAANGLVGKRVTWSVSAAVAGARLLRKVGGLPGSSADITITSQTAAAIAGTINITAADWGLLAGKTYYATLWTDDGAGNDRCVTVGGTDTIAITDDVARAP